MPDSEQVLPLSKSYEYLQSSLRCPLLEIQVTSEQDDPGHNFED